MSEKQTAGQQEFYRIYRDGLRQGFTQGVRYTLLWGGIGLLGLAAVGAFAWATWRAL